LLGASTNAGNLASPWGNALGLQSDPSQLVRIQLLQNLLQVVNASTLLNPFEGLVNGWEYMNPPGLLIPQAPSNSQDIANSSWGNGFEGGSISPELVIGVKNSSLSGGSSPCENPTENPLPELVSAPPGTHSTVNQMESMTDPNQLISTSLFEDWDKLMDDETSDSYWKEMLE
jgi:myb proto-oncogene protein